MAGEAEIEAQAALVPVDRWMKADFLQPRFRVTDQGLVVQRPAFERIGGPLVLGGAGLGLVLASFGAPLVRMLSLALIGTALILVGALVARRSMPRIQLVLDHAGWRRADGRRSTLVPWGEIAELYVFRGSDPMGDFLRTRAEDRVPLGAFLPEPRVHNTQHTDGTFDLLCHLQHDVAHRFGVQPIPIRVDLGKTGETVPFAHPCPICGSS